jgi:hypothetical protein
MIGVAMYITIKSLWERRKTKSLIVRLTDHDWKTITRKIKEKQPQDIRSLLEIFRIIKSPTYRNTFYIFFQRL